MSSSHRQWGRLAVVGALVAALGLSACGRKGPLDPPPTASAVPAQTAEAAPAAREPAAPGFLDALPGTSQPAGSQATLGPESSAPTAPPPSGRRDRFFLDWLLD